MPRKKEFIKLVSFHRIKENETIKVEENGCKFSIQRYGNCYYLCNRFGELIMVDKDIKAIKNYIAEYSKA